MKKILLSVDFADVIGGSLEIIFILLFFSFIGLIVSLLLRHFFNKKYPNLNAQWIINLPVTHVLCTIWFWLINISLLNILASINMTRYVTGIDMSSMTVGLGSNNNIGDTIDVLENFMGWQFGLSFIFMLVMAFTDIIILYRAFNFTKYTWQQLKKVSVIGSFCIIICFVISICSAFILYEASPIIGIFLQVFDFIGVYWTWHTYSKYQEEVPKILSSINAETIEHLVYNGVRNISSNSNTIKETVKEIRNNQHIQTRISNNEKLCPYCGETILAIAKKCRYCGEWMPKEQEEKPKEMVVCPICGEEVEKGTKICPHCKEEINA